VLQLPDTEDIIRFQTAVRMHVRSHRSDGVTFRLQLTDSEGKTTTHFDQHVNTQESTRISVDLSPWRG